MSSFIISVIFCSFLVEKEKVMECPNKVHKIVSFLYFTYLLYVMFSYI